GGESPRRAPGAVGETQTASRGAGASRGLTMRRPPANLVSRLARAALLEDLGPGDLTCRALLPDHERARGVVTAGAALVLAGLDAARHAFLALDPEVRFEETARPGDEVSAGGIVLKLEGDAAAILSAERTALNFLGRLSGIATLTRRCVEA